MRREKKEKKIQEIKNVRKSHIKLNRIRQSMYNFKILAGLHVSPPLFGNGFEYCAPPPETRQAVYQSNS